MVRFWNKILDFGTNFGDACRMGKGKLVMRCVDCNCQFFVREKVIIHGVCCACEDKLRRMVVDAEIRIARILTEISHNQILHDRRKEVMSNALPPWEINGPAPQVGLST